MSQAADDPQFDGISGLKCEGFIQLVRRKAFSEGKSKDDEWMAQYAGMCFDGSAFRWYESLDEEVQDSWKLLRTAMLRQWPASGMLSGGNDVIASSSSSSVASSTPSPFRFGVVPTPAAAPPPQSPLAALAPPAALPTSSTVGRGNKRGRLQIIYENGAHYGYVSESLNKHGLYQTTQLTSEALNVEFQPSFKPHNLWSTSGPTKAQYIGLTWATTQIATEVAEQLSQGITFWAGLATMDTAQNGFSTNLSTTLYSGPSRSCIWNFLIDGSTQLMWEGTLKRVSCLELAIHSTGVYFNTIQVVSNFDVFFAHHKDPAWTRVRMVFEPL